MHVLLLFLFCWTNIFRDFALDGTSIHNTSTIECKVSENTTVVQQKRNKKRTHTIKSNRQVKFILKFIFYDIFLTFAIIYITILNLARLGHLCTWLCVLQFWTEIKVVITNRTSRSCDFVITRLISVQIVPTQFNFQYWFCRFTTQAICETLKTSVKLNLNFTWPHAITYSNAKCTLAYPNFTLKHDILC